MYLCDVYVTNNEKEMFTFSHATEKY